MLGFEPETVKQKATVVSRILVDVAKVNRQHIAYEEESLKTLTVD